MLQEAGCSRDWKLLGHRALSISLLSCRVASRFSLPVYELACDGVISAVSKSWSHEGHKINRRFQDFRLTVRVIRKKKCYRRKGRVRILYHLHESRHFLFCRGRAATQYTIRTPLHLDTANFLCVALLVVSPSIKAQTKIVYCNSSR